VIEDLTGALTGRQPKSLSVNKRFVWGYLPVERKIYLKDGRAIIAKGDEHPDPAAEAPRYQVCEGELIQASGRGRGIHRTVEHPLQEDRVFDNSLGGVIDEASTWAVPSAAIEMLVEGMMLTSRVDMMKAWSDIWRSDSAARRTLEDLKQEPHCSLFARLLRGWRPVTYQLAGAKMKPRVAYFDPTCVADPRLWLEQRFGPLELFMDGGPHWAALLDGFST
jgi:putative DNA primase/helicase